MARAEPPLTGAGRPARIAVIAALLAGSVLVSRVLGYVREVVLASMLGAGAEVDAYRAGFQLSDLLNHFIAGGALSITLIPLYARRLAEEGEAGAERLFAKVLGTMGTLVVTATLGLWWWAPELVAFQFPDFAPETLELTTRLTRIVLPAQIFFVLGGIVRAALMARDRFVSQALAPLLYNAGIIGFGIALGAQIGAEGFAWGALAGAAVGALGVALLEARAAGVRIRVRFALFDREFLSYLALAAPLLIGVTLLTADEWFDRWFGARLGAGAVATLGYARYLMQMPVGVIGQAIGTAALPTLSRLYAAGRREELDRTLLDTLRGGLALAVIAAAFFAAFAVPVVRVLFEHGRFAEDPEAGAAVARMTRIFALAVPAWILQQIQVRSFYARGEMWRPMIMGSVIVLGAVPVYLALGERYGAPGLAAAGAMAMSTNALATLIYGRFRHGAPGLLPLLGSGLRVLPVALGAAWAGEFVLAERTGTVGAMVDLVVGGTVFGGIALAGAWIFGDAPTRATLGRLLARLRRRRIPSEE